MGSGVVWRRALIEVLLGFALGYVGGELVLRTMGAVPWW